MKPWWMDKPSKKLKYEGVPCQKQKRKVQLFADTKAVSINSIESFVILFQRLKIQTTKKAFSQVWDLNDKGMHWEKLRKKVVTHSLV